MLVITTGISGCGRKGYLDDFAALAKKNDKNVKIYHVGEMMFEHAKKIGINISRENVLNANPNVINSIRSTIFEAILSELPQVLKKHDAVFINIHSFFFWKKIFMRVYDSAYLSELNPDMFVTFIDNATVIRRKLNTRDQWKPEKLSNDEILLWQNVEVEVTASWAEFHKKPFFAIAALQSQTSFYRLLFNPEVEPIYVSMPMTHLSKDGQTKVNSFVREIEKYFAVFDPRTIEIAVGLAKNKIDKTSYNQTVLRDLYWIIKQSKKIITYFPELVSSPGAINELREGYETNKDVWLIYPQKTASPFLTYFCNKFFQGEAEFYKFLRKHYTPAPKLN